MICQQCKSGIKMADFTRLLDTIKITPVNEKYSIDYSFFVGYDNSKNKEEGSCEYVRLI